MKINHLGHTAFRVADLQKSVEFYVGCLGLEKAFEITLGQFADQVLDGVEGEERERLRAEYERRKDEVSIVYIKVAPGEFIELFPGDQPLQKLMLGPGHSGYLHLCLEVDDVHSWRAHLLEKGVNVTSEITLGCDNAYQFWMKDPDGNDIEMMQYLPNAYQLVGK